MLAAVERDLADEPVVVIGVHSPKFPTERDPELVRQAIRRHGVTHPVVVDSRFEIWQRYAVRAWPTLVLIRPDGTIVGMASGEPDRGPLRRLLERTLRENGDELVRGPLPLRPEPAPPGSLAFPGGVAVGDDRVYVADTGHHQVVVCDPHGTELGRLGTGTLRYPHGLAVTGDGRLIVADTGNHTVRAIDLQSGEVETLAGTGARGRLSPGGPALETALRSPWDVAIASDGGVLIAMAGSHQLWRIAGGHAELFAGTGQEARVDGPVRSAAFAQPSGLAFGTDGALYVADSEISAVRRVAGGMVSTVAGGDLFYFGDADGSGDDVRFQHPVGIGEGPAGTLLVADTLNSKIKQLDPRTRAVRTLFGNGRPFDAALAELEGRRRVPADVRGTAFCREPEAVAPLDDRMLVVDTGNQRVLAVAPATGAAEVWLG